MNAQARLGAFVLVALLLLGFATGRVGKMDFFKQETNLVEAEFTDLYGLELQAPVRMAGVKVGIVQDTYLDNNRAVVRIALKPGVRLPASTRASIASRGLVGEKYISLNAKAGDNEELPDGARIPTDLGGDINVFIARVTAVTDDLGSLSHALTDFLGTKKGPSKLQTLIDNADNTIGQLSAILKENHEGLTNTIRNLSETSDAIRHDLPDTLSSLRQATEDVSKIASKIPDAVAAGQNFFEQGEQAAKHVGQVVLDNRENLLRTIFEFRKTAEHLEELSDDLRRNPWKLMAKKPEIKRSKRARQAKMEEMLLSTGHMGIAPARK